MKQGFRDALRLLEEAGELRRIKKAVDPRHLSALAAQAKEATFFEAIEGYPSWRVAGALVSTRKRLALAMGCSEADIARRFEDGIRHPVDAKLVSDGPCQEIVWQGDAVDLTAIPIPLMHVKDGGPYISATMVVSKDPEYGRNVGSYRLMYRTPRETGIDLVSSSDMRRYYQRALDAGRPLEIAVAVGVHPYEMLAASYKTPIEAAGLQALRIASVEPVAIRAPVGGCCYWTLVASIRKRPGEGKNALLALLSVAEVKLAIVTDDDINIYDPDDLDWAMTFRVQADHDVLVIPGARGKHIDPSVRAWSLGKGGLPTTAKLGIDATIPEGVPREQYERLRYFAKDAVRLEDYL